jgi:hypothetical protein
VADFHALRHTYFSRIVRSGATAKAAQALARHSTVTLTLGRYAHVGLYDLAAAVNDLPAIVPPSSRSNASVGVLRATGTDDRISLPQAQNGEDSLGPLLGPQPAISRDFLRPAETIDSDVSPIENPGNNAVFRDFSGA